MMKTGIKPAFILLFLFCYECGATGNRPGFRSPQIVTPSVKTISVDRYGVKADGKTDDSPAFLKAWAEACAVEGAVRIYVPKTTLLVGPMFFKGPCKGKITFQIDALLLATTDLNRYDPIQASWIQFYGLDGLTVIGGGTLDGQGPKSWLHNTCSKNLHNCKVLPSTIKFLNTNNTLFKGLTSLNSKFFHVAIVDCRNFKASGLKIIAPENSPNTDGIHVERSTGVTISQTKIGTGDDCISIGHGNSDILIKDVTCGPGHGISVGSLGRYRYEKDVRGVVVKSCTLIGTDNGVRIKTWANSPSGIFVSNMTFENIVMDKVLNPIIVDQYYCPWKNCILQGESKVKINDISFKNIRGTTPSTTAVLLHCSKANPCQNVRVRDIHFEPVVPGLRIASTCKNIKAMFGGFLKPGPCIP